MSPDYILTYIFNHKANFKINYDTPDFIYIRKLRISKILNDLILVVINLKTFDCEFRFKNSRKNLECKLDKDDFEKLLIESEIT